MNRRNDWHPMPVIDVFASEFVIERDTMSRQEADRSPLSGKEDLVASAQESWLSNMFQPLR
ncbi:hypothetical protein WG66_010806 [Moniliophthora roreri]|nr:hypothetical protein WG66_010806 [Moniliophthora roreri]